MKLEDYLIEVSCNTIKGHCHNILVSNWKDFPNVKLKDVSDCYIRYKGMPIACIENSTVKVIQGPVYPKECMEFRGMNRILKLNPYYNIHLAFRYLIPNLFEAVNRYEEAWSKV